MPLATLMKDLNFDRYDRNARLQPALLAILPLLVSIGVWAPGIRSSSGWAVSLAAACGALFLMAQATRRRGRALERAWGDRIGRRHSARLLSFADDTIGGVRKRRIREWIGLHGRALPDADAERADPRGADDERMSAIAWLLEVTRPDAETSLLLAENVSYGFWRNMRGLRPLGIGLAFAAAAGNAALLHRVGAADPGFWLGVAALGFCVVAMAAWSLLVTVRAVEDASLAYAERLFAQIDNPAVNERLRAAAAPATAP